MTGLGSATIQISLDPLSQTQPGLLKIMPIFTRHSLHPDYFTVKIFGSKLAVIFCINGIQRIFFWVVSGLFFYDRYLQAALSSTDLFLLYFYEISRKALSLSGTKIFKSHLKKTELNSGPLSPRALYYKLYFSTYSTCIKFYSPFWLPETCL